MQIYGDTSDLSPSETKALQRIYRRRVPLDRLTTSELTRALVGVSHATGRQVGVLVDRRGTVHHVILGDASKLMLPDVGRLRAGAGRLRGLRLVHTHLRNEPLSRDDLVDLTRLRLDLVVAICLAPGEERALCIYYGYNFPVAEGVDEPPFQTFGPIPYAKARDNPAETIASIEQEFARAARARGVTAKDGRAILVHVCDKQTAGQAEDSLRELEELARTAGVDVADRVLQVRDRVDPKYALGRGKLEDLVIRAMQLDVETLVFDRDLRPAQANNIARVTDLRVVDRTQLILDIFAQHAESRDGKLQVELAQMRYLLPRLGQRDDALSRLTGGIGGRGPGETKLEVGRRRARERIARLQSQLKQLGRQRVQRRSRRRRSGTPTVAIVGYTNAGKSTLLNSLTGSDVVAEDKLFATLDTRSRSLALPSGQNVIVTDTVGFIRDLPKDLFAAFRATFDETQDADLLLHVIDASDPSREDHIETTERLLVDLGLERVPRILVFNKCDRLDVLPSSVENRGVAVSAIDRNSLDVLRHEIDEAISQTTPTTQAPEPTSSPLA